MHRDREASVATPTDETPAIAVQGLTKRFGDRVAVDALSIEVPTGAVAGFIGPNGAGKTTTMSMLLGLIEPSAGRGTVLCEPITAPHRYMSRVGALIEGPALYPGLTGRENLRLLATVAGHDPDAAVDKLEVVGLGDRGDDRFATYSMGMKQRLAIAAALIGEPALLMLDEPINGLDPAGIRHVRRLVGDLAAGGCTLFLSSHVLAELQHVCDWLVIIDDGAVAYQGPSEDFLARAASTIEARPHDPGQLDQLTEIATDLAASVEHGDGSVLIDPNGLTPTDVAARLNRAAFDAGVVIAELRIDREQLEDRYLALIQHDQNDLSGAVR